MPSDYYRVHQRGVAGGGGLRLPSACPCFLKPPFQKPRAVPQKPASSIRLLAMHPPEHGARGLCNCGPREEVCGKGLRRCCGWRSALLRWLSWRRGRRERKAGGTPIREAVRADFGHTSPPTRPHCAGLLNMIFPAKHRGLASIVTCAQIPTRPLSLLPPLF